MIANDVSFVDTWVRSAILSQTVSKLKDILDREGITQAQLVRESGLSSATIGRLCREHATNVREVTKNRVKNALGEMTGKEYKITDLF